jgi:hypothetical protein
MAVIIVVTGLTAITPAACTILAMTNASYTRPTVGAGERLATDTLPLALRVRVRSLWIIRSLAHDTRRIFGFSWHQSY